MKLIATTIFTLFCYINIFSQKQVIKLEDERIRLDKYLINIDTIINVCEEKECIGYIRRDLSSKVIPVYLDKPFDQFLHETLYNFDSNVKTENLILRVNKLQIYENINSGNINSTVELNISFITKSGDKYYEKYQAATAITSIMGIDSKNMHKKSIIKALESCFLQYYHRSRLQRFSSQDLTTETQLNINPLRIQKFKIQTKPKLTKGIYFSFADFRDYTPDTTKQFIIKNTSTNNHSTTAILRSPNGNDFSHIWGFTDGEAHYKQIHNEFNALIENQNGFTLYDYPPEFELNSVALGFVGGLLLQSIYALNVEKIGYTLNLTNGKFYPSNYIGEDKTESNTIVIFSKYSKTDDNIELFVNGKKTGKLRKGTYKSLIFGSDTERFELGVKDSKGLTAYQTVEPVLFNTGLYLAKLNKGKLTLEPIKNNLHDKMINYIKEGKYTNIK